MNQDIQLLFVDDDELIADAFRAYFEDEGYQVEIAPTAEHGLTKVFTKPITLCVVDMRLPGVDGNDFIHIAHRLKPELRFLVYTGSTNYILPDSLRSIGMCDEDVFLKPVKDMQLIEHRIQQKLTT